jgi:hypothetical protein
VNDLPAQAPGAVKVIMSGSGPDLVKVAIFLEAVTSDHNPAAILADLRLNGIEITSTRGTRGRGKRITMILELTGADQ